jgi:hypothetical protein
MIKDNIQNNELWSKKDLKIIEDIVKNRGERVFTQESQEELQKQYFPNRSVKAIDNKIILARKKLNIRIKKPRADKQIAPKEAMLTPERVWQCVLEWHAKAEGRDEKAIILANTNRKLEEVLAENKQLKTKLEAAEAKCARLSLENDHKDNIIATQQLAVRGIAISYGD